MLQGLLTPHDRSSTRPGSHAPRANAPTIQKPQQIGQNQDEYTVQSPRAVVKGNMAENPHPTWVLVRARHFARNGGTESPAVGVQHKPSPDGDGEELHYDIAGVMYRAGSGLAGLTLMDARIPQQTGLLVIALRKLQDEKHRFVCNPAAHTRLDPADEVNVLGKPEQIAQLENYVEA